MMTDLSVEQLTKKFDTQIVVNDVSFHIKNQEFIVILGPSGCGKSTLLRMIAGLENITSGTISIDGKLINHLEPRERGCAMVFQNYALYPHMSVADNIGYSLKVAGVSKEERLRRIADISKILGIDDLLSRKPSQLSGGQRQRVAMGRAMIRNPKLFLFDEPLSNLDAKLRMQMRMEIRKLHNKIGATSIFVTHDQVEAMSLADRIIIMNNGRIEQIDTPDVIYNAPATKFVAHFIGSPAMNLLQAKVDVHGQLSVGSQHIPIDRALPCCDQDVIMGVRPENVILARSDQPHMLFQSELCENIGAHQLIHGKIQDQDFVVQMPAGHAYQSATYPLSIKPGSMQLFDRHTGRRLAV